MMMPNIGQLVAAHHKTGAYIAEVVEIAGSKALLKTLGVTKHPTQGDLHNPNQADVVLFHQRRALAYLEKVWVPLQAIEVYEGSIPDYQATLREALEKEIAHWTQALPSRFAERCLIELENLKTDYFPKG
ncbi:kinase-associated lipoprotein B [Brevibacillus fluminis]|nr:kinase-associated lipoprotein B [Brevibacillus fluminis]